MEPRQTPVNGANHSIGRSRLLFAVIFLSFFFGIQSLTSGLPGVVFLGFSRNPEHLNRLVETTAFSPVLLATLFIYQLVFGLTVLVAAYFLLIRPRESARRVLGIMFAVDVFLFLGVALYYRHLQFQPPSAEQFYYDVFCTFLEIVLVVCLSHASIVGLTQAGPRSNARGKTETDA